MRTPARRRGLAARLALVLVPLFLAACAPRLQEIGPETAPPMLADETIVMADGAALPLEIWRPTDRAPDAKPAAVILALHGFNDYSNAFEAPAQVWATRGIQTYAYDQRGFGRAPQPGLWPGDERLVADLRAAARLVADRHPGVPLYILGESMGGAVVAAAAVSPDPPAAAGLILVAPAVWGRETQGPLQSGLLWLGAHTVPWMKLTGEGLNIQPSDNIAMLRALGRDPLVIKATRIDTIYGLVGLMDRAWEAAPRLGRGPTLLLYGAREEVIPEDAALAWVRRLPPGIQAGTQAGSATGAGPRRVAIYRGGYHMLLRDLGAEIVLDDIAAWIADGRAPFASGADALAAALISGEAEDFASVRAPEAEPAGAEAPPITVNGAAAAILGP
jgi:alpha-beta hydrolase superfamily lysophospholipase